MHSAIEPYPYSISTGISPYKLEIGVRSISSHTRYDITFIRKLLDITTAAIAIHFRPQRIRISGGPLREKTKENANYEKQDRYPHPLYPKK